MGRGKRANKPRVPGAALKKPRGKLRHGFACLGSKVAAACAIIGVRKRKAAAAYAAGAPAAAVRAAGYAYADAVCERAALGTSGAEDTSDTEDTDDTDNSDSEHADSSSSGGEHAAGARA
jgi:hypothetical protein